MYPQIPQTRADQKLPSQTCWKPRPQRCSPEAATLLWLLPRDPTWVISGCIHGGHGRHLMSVIIYRKAIVRMGGKKEMKEVVGGGGGSINHFRQVTLNMADIYCDLNKINSGYSPHGEGGPGSALLFAIGDSIVRRLGCNEWSSMGTITPDAPLKNIKDFRWAATYDYFIK